MEASRGCLDKCGLVDLGFIGKKFIWCNGRDGVSRTKLRLDRMVANEEWLKRFSNARVFHTAMSILDHCLLKLKLSNRQNRRKPKKRFMFEAMWTRDDRCREVVESAWDSCGGDSNLELSNMLKRCKENI